MERTCAIELYLWRYLQCTLLPPGVPFGAANMCSVCLTCPSSQCPALHQGTSVDRTLVQRVFNVPCACLQNGIHYVRFLVDGVWQVSANMPTAKDGDGIPCNVITVHARDNFAVYYKTGWRTSELQYRVLDRDGLPMSKVRPHTEPGLQLSTMTPGLLLYLVFF